MSHLPRSRALIALVSALILVLGSAGGAIAQTPSPDGDDKVSGQPYVRHDGGTDVGRMHNCLPELYYFPWGTLLP